MGYCRVRHSRPQEIPPDQKPLWVYGCSFFLPVVSPFPMVRMMMLGGAPARKRVRLRAITHRYFTRILIRLHPRIAGENVMAEAKQTVPFCTVWIGEDPPGGGHRGTCAASPRSP